MTEEFVPFLKSLKVPLLTKAEVAALGQLQQEWKHWEEREWQHAPLRVAEDQKTAYAAFLDDPSPENEQCLASLADPILTGTRYALLCRAFQDVRRRISARAGEILRPVIERISAALAAEHARRLEKSEPVRSNVNNNPVVKESRRMVDYADSMSHRIYLAVNAQSGKSPMELADVLISGGQ